ncbi:MAG TPA: S-layer homology domain-containing protein [Bacillota bacterium]|nr:S-layer homology domain-containing protein [Bacillota bacterium]
MIKRAVLLVLCLILLLPGLAYAEEEHPASLEKPASLSVRSNESGDLLLRLTHPQSIMKQMEEDEYYFFYEFDWKINDGPWKFNKSWDRRGNISLFEYYETTFDLWPVCGIINTIAHDDRNSIDIPIFPYVFELDAFDFQNNTYSFRFRYVYEYPDGDGYSHIVSPWSDVASIGKASAAQIPDSLEAPRNLAGELRKYENGQPYFHFTCDIPESVEEANKLVKVWNALDWKIGSGSWATESGELLFEEGSYTLFDKMDIDPIDEGGWGEINIEENTYYFRMFFKLQKPDGTIVRSPFSNVVEIGTPAFYSGASSWAEPELDEAAEYGLIPDILKGADMTKPITREEFAELAVLLYEKASGKTAVPVSPNPFTDTNNPQILKAFATGITAGTSATTFSPNVLINREQCATMLYRTIKAIAPDADYSIAGVADFPDQKDISDWAVEGTKYMFKLGIIKGDSNGNFMPKAITTAQQAAGYGMATREAAVLMTVRTYEKMDDISATKSVSDTGGDGDATSLPEGYPSDIIPLYKNGKIVSVERKTFDTGDVGYAITIDYVGEKTSEVNGHYAGLMMQADNYDGIIGVKSHHYGNLGGYRIEIDFTQHFPDQYSCTVVIAYYKTN